MERQKKRPLRTEPPEKKAQSSPRGAAHRKNAPERGREAPLKQAAPKRRFDLHRIFSSAEIVLVGKDLGAIWRNKGARALLMLLPVVLVVLVPLLYSVAISFLPTEESLAMPERLAAMLHGLEGPVSYTHLDVYKRQGIFPHQQLVDCHRGQHHAGPQHGEHIRDSGD